MIRLDTSCLPMGYKVWKNAAYIVSGPSAFQGFKDLTVTLVSSTVGILQRFKASKVVFWVTESQANNERKCPLS